MACHQHPIHRFPSPELSTPPATLIRIKRDSKDYEISFEFELLDYNQSLVCEILPAGAYSWDPRRIRCKLREEVGTCFLLLALTCSLFNACPSWQASRARMAASADRFNRMVDAVRLGDYRTAHNLGSLRASASMGVYQLAGPKSDRSNGISKSTSGPRSSSVTIHLLPTVMPLAKFLRFEENGPATSIRIMRPSTLSVSHPRLMLGRRTNAAAITFPLKARATGLEPRDFRSDVPLWEATHLGLPRTKLTDPLPPTIPLGTLNALARGFKVLSLPGMVSITPTGTMRMLMERRLRKPLLRALWLAHRAVRIGIPSPTWISKLQSAVKLPPSSQFLWMLT